MPRVYIFPFWEILEGVVLERVATPPLSEKLKSDTSRLPLAELVLNTASFIVTETVLLSFAIVVEVIIGGD